VTYLADTHALIWHAESPERLSPAARAVMDDSQVRVLFSIATVWEMAIKISLQKLRIEGSVSDFAYAQQRKGFELLPIRLPQLVRVAALELHHRDPFDRMLIAQALEEDLQLITADPTFGKYPIGILW